MHHLKKHPATGNYYYRQAVPKALRALLGKTEYHHNLHTKDPALARYLGYILSAQTLVHFQELKQAMSTDRKPEDEEARRNASTSFLDGIYKKSVEQNPEKTRINKFDGKANFLTGEISLTVNPNNPADIKAGEEWQDKTVKQMQSMQKMALPKTTTEVIERAEHEKQRLYASINAGIKKRVKLKIALEEYKKQKSGKPAFLKHTFPALAKWAGWVVEQYPNVTVNQINSDDIKAYRDYVEVNTFNNKTQTLGIEKDTVNIRLGFIQTFFKWCQKTPQGYYKRGQENLPTFELFFTEEFKDNAEKDRHKFTDNDLRIIFKPENYLAWVKKPHYLIPPIVALYTGSRLNEVCELDPECIQQDFTTGVWYVDWNKGLKNYTTKRTTPLHPALIEFGLLDYIEDLKATVDKPATLFPYLLDIDKAVGGRFADYLKALGIKTPKKVFHSFRHSCINAMTNGGVVNPFKKHYTGHKDSSVQAEIYDDHEHPFIIYKKAISKIQFPVDIERIKYVKGSAVKTLNNEMKIYRAKLKTASTKQKGSNHGNTVKAGT